MTFRGICRGLRGVTDSQKLPSQPQCFQKEPAVRSRRPRYPCVSAPSPAQVTNGRGIPAMPAWVGGAFTEHSRRSPPGPRLMPGSLTSFKSPELQVHPGVPTRPSPAAPALISCFPPLSSIIGQQHSAWWWPLPLSVPWGQQPAFLSGTLSHYLPPSWSQNTVPSKKNGSLLHPSPQLKLCPPPTLQSCYGHVSQQRDPLGTHLLARECKNLFSPAHPSIASRDGQHGHRVGAQESSVRWRTRGTGSGEMRGSQRGSCILESAILFPRLPAGKAASCRNCLES